MHWRRIIDSDKICVLRQGRGVKIGVREDPRAEGGDYLEMRPSIKSH